MKTPVHTAYLLLGSNIDPEDNIPRAVSLLAGKVTILQASSVWQSASADCCYPDFLNQALWVCTRLDANELKSRVLRVVEAEMGRVRTEDKNADRPIDCDIIIFDGELLDPEIWKRVHIAMPVSELIPNFTSEAGETLRNVARRLAQIDPIQLRTDVPVKLNEH